MSLSGLDKARMRTEAEARAEGHTATPWFPCRHSGGGETGADIDIEVRPGGWFIQLSPGHPFSQMAYPAEAEREFNANVAFVMLAVNSYDSMRKALEAARHALVTSQGCFATNIVPERRKDLIAKGASIEWTIDDSKALAEIDAAIALARGERP